MSCRHPARRRAVASRYSGAGLRPAMPRFVGAFLGSPRCSEECSDESGHGRLKARATVVSVRNFRYLPWLERLEKLAGAIMIEHRIGSFDTQKETVAAGQCES